MRRLILVALLALAACTQPPPTVIVVPAERCWQTRQTIHPSTRSRNLGTSPQYVERTQVEVPCP